MIEASEASAGLQRHERNPHSNGPSCFQAWFSAAIRDSISITVPDLRMHMRVSE
jgi:hypothetical protein